MSKIIINKKLNMEYDTENPDLTNRILDLYKRCIDNKNISRDIIENLFECVRFVLTYNLKTSEGIPHTKTIDSEYPDVLEFVGTNFLEKGLDPGYCQSIINALNDIKEKNDNIGVYEIMANKTTTKKETAKTKEGKLIVTTREEAEKEKANKNMQDILNEQESIIEEEINGSGFIDELKELVKKYIDMIEEGNLDKIIDVACNDAATKAGKEKMKIELVGRAGEFATKNGVAINELSKEQIKEFVINYVFCDELTQLKNVLNGLSIEGLNSIMTNNEYVNVFEYLLGEKYIQDLKDKSNSEPLVDKVRRYSKAIKDEYTRKYFISKSLSRAEIDLNEYMIIKEKSELFNYLYEGLLHEDGEIKDINGEVIETLYSYYGVI